MLRNPGNDVACTSTFLLIEEHIQYGTYIALKKKSLEIAEESLVIEKKTRHYYFTWNDATPYVALDPWLFDKTPLAPTGASNYTDASGKGEEHVYFDYGYGYGDNVEKVIVIHESKAISYGKIARGVLMPTSSSSSLRSMTSKRS
jgi:hypothetical protein